VSAGAPGDLCGAHDEVEAGDKNVELYFRKFRGCMISPKSPAAPLMGKPLPNLRELNIHLSKSDIRGKRILVCFCKTSERKSRDCIRELAARSDELRKKRVIVVAAQIWPRNEKQFRRWLAKNSVHFPVSILPDPWKQEPEQRASYRWGVQGSVPWLILTDTEHVVRAEGFTLNVLDDKIRGTATTKMGGKLGMPSR